MRDLATDLCEYFDALSDQLGASAVAEVHDPVKVAGSRRHGGGLVAAAVVVVCVVIAAMVAVRTGADSESAPAVGVVAPNEVEEVSHLSLTEPRYGPRLLAAGGATLWVGDIRGPVEDGDPSAFRVDPSTGEVTPTFTSGPVVSVDPTTGDQVSSLGIPDIVVGMAYGFDALWLATSRLDGTSPFGALLRIDPLSATITGRIDLEYPGRGIAIGHGSVWVANSRVPTLDRIDPDSMQITTSIPAQAALITSNRDGIWISSGGTTIRRIDPSTNSVDKVVKLRGAPPTQMLSTGRRLWVAVPPGSGPARLVAIDTRTGARVENVKLRGAPTALASGDGLVWCMINAIRPEKRLVAINDHGGTLQEVKMATNIHAVDLAVANGYLFVADSAAGQLVRMR